MKFLLKLKHWQLFGLTWGLAILMNVFTFSDPSLMIKSFPIIMIFFVVGTFGWIWAIAVHLNPKLPENVKLNCRRFQIIFSIPLVYILVLAFWMGFTFLGIISKESANHAAVVTIIIALHLFSMVVIFWGMAFAAKTLKSVELGRKAKFGDYAGDFMLIWFSIIGYWVLQPRLNKLIEDKY